MDKVSEGLNSTKQLADQQGHPPPYGVILDTLSRRGEGPEVNRTVEDPETRTMIITAKSPFEIPLLLNRIFNFLSLKDLKSVRLVSKEWKASSQPQLRNYWLQIGHTDRLQRIWNYNEEPGTFCNFELLNDVCLTHREILLFFEIYGQHIKALKMPNKGWKVKELQNIIFNKVPVLQELQLVGDLPINSDARLVDGLEASQKLTQLKKVVLHLTNGEPTTHTNGLVNGYTNRFITDLLSIAPNLEVVRCASSRDMKITPTLSDRVAKEVDRRPYQIANSLDCINNFLTHKLISSNHIWTPKLVNLDLELRLYDWGIQKLEVKHYNLKALDLHIRYFHKESLLSLLRSMGTSLKFLRLRLDTRQMLDLSLPFLTELESLLLQQYVGSLLFLDEMPKLKTLVLEQFGARKFIYENFPSTISFNSKITELTLDTVRPLGLQGNSIKKLAILLPHIRSLTLKEARDSDLLRIFDSMPLLEHLTLVSKEKGHLTNSGLSGYTDVDVERILKAGYEFVKHSEYEGMRRLPYIGDLTCLKTLSLEGDLKGLTPQFWTRRMTIPMHGLWIFHGIGNLKNLQILSIQEAEISTMELKYLVKNMDLYRLELKNCGFDPRMEKWIREKTFGKAFELILRK